MSNPATLVSTFNDTLAFTDASGTGTWTAVTPTRYGAVGAQNGIWVEQATTNLITNPSFEVDTTGWATQGTTDTHARVTSAAYVGTAALHVVATNQTYAGTKFALASGYTLGTTYTFSAWIKGAANDTGRMVVFGSGDTLSNAFTLATSGWERISVTGTSTATGGVELIIDCAEPAQSIDWLIDATQMEATSYATSYTDGTLGSGYAWTGAAHASTSTRAASSVSVDQNGTARISPSAGSIAFKYKRNIDTAGEELLLTCGVVGAATDYLEIGIDINDDPYMEWNSNGAGANRVTITDTIAADTEYFLYFDWDGTTIRASRDNGSLTSGTRDAVQGDWSTGDLALSAATGSQLVGPFAVFDSTLSADQRSALNGTTAWDFAMLNTGIVLFTHRDAPNRLRFPRIIRKPRAR